jgi:hypothetical protein
MAKFDVYYRDVEGKYEIYLQGGARKSKTKDLFLGTAADLEGAEFLTTAATMAVWCQCDEEQLEANAAEGKSKLLEAAEAAE